MDLDVLDIPQRADTGHLPSPTDVEAVLEGAFERSLHHKEGEVATYIPALAKADKESFGVAIVDVTGRQYKRGDCERLFSIQSISKAFVYALLCDRVGHERAFELVGVNNTGLPFNSVMAIELHNGHPRNPMVNAGALATTALVPGSSPAEQWQFIIDGLSAFAGRELEVDQGVYDSEMAGNHRNIAIARLLQSYGRLDGDPESVVAVYTRQCSVLVNAIDLAAMGSTLANGGTNPLTSNRVVSPDVARDTLAVMAASGLYENSGEWLFDIGLPGKSGVAGGLVTVAPGKGGIGSYAPPLDPAGNSVRGQVVAAYLSRGLGLNIFSSNPIPPKLTH